MAYPTTIVEIAFDGTPYDVSPTWTAVTSYVRLVNTHRGRSDDFADFDTGTAQVVLDNRTRLFDPFYTSGTYYGKLLPRKQIRIRATSGATTYDVWRGYITGWPVSFTEAGLDSTVTLQCFDALGLLATEIITDDWYQTYLREQATAYSAPLRHYWKCDDAPSQTYLVDAVNPATPLNYVAATPTTSFPFISAQPLFPGLTGTAAACSYYTMTSSDTTTPSGSTISFVIQPANISSSYNVGLYYQRGYMYFSCVFDTANGKATFTYRRNNDGIKYVLAMTAGTLNPNIAHHIWFYTDTYGTYPAVIIDGVLFYPFTDSANTNTSASESLIVSNCTIQEISIDATGGYNYNIGKKLYGYAAGQGFYDYQYLETTRQRLATLMAQSPYTNFSYSANYSTLGGYSDIPNMTAKIENTGQLLPQLRTTQNTEGGEIFCKKDGSVLFTDRYYQYSNAKSTAVQAAFSDAGGATLKYGKELTLDYDADNIRNSVTVNYTSGYTGSNNYIATNTTSTASVGKVADTIDTYLPTAAAATTLADLQLGVGAALKPRVSPLEVGVTSQTADWQTLLGLELLERITVTRTPSTGNAITQTMLINSIDHTIRPGVWETTITGSTRYTGWFTLDVSALDGTDILV
jgi:hypothetical protein